MYDECLIFLYYKGLYSEIFKLTKAEFIKLTEELKSNSDENK